MAFQGALKPSRPRLPKGLGVPIALRDETLSVG